MQIYSFFLGVYVEKEGDNNINMLNLRLLKNSAAFYSKNSESDQFCLQDGFNYNEIKDCEIEYKVKFQSINDIDTACCLKYKRNLGGGIEYEEKICSFRQNIEICVLEIKQVQKHLINGCLGLKNTLSKEDLDFLSPNLKDIEKVTVVAGELITIKPKNVHVFKALEDTVMIDMISLSREGSRYEEDVVRIDIDLEKE